MRRFAPSLHSAERSGSPGSQRRNPPPVEQAAMFARRGAQRRRPARKRTKENPKPPLRPTKRIRTSKTGQRDLHLSVICAKHRAPCLSQNSRADAARLIWPMSEPNLAWYAADLLRMHTTFDLFNQERWAGRYPMSTRCRCADAITTYYTAIRMKRIGGRRLGSIRWPSRMNSGAKARASGRSKRTAYQHEHWRAAPKQAGGLVSDKPAIQLPATP